MTLHIATGAGGHTGAVLVRLPVELAGTRSAMPGLSRAWPSAQASMPDAEIAGRSLPVPGLDGTAGLLAAPLFP